MNSLSTRKTLLIAVLTALGAGSMASASAATDTWQQHHARRVEVHHRLAHQGHRIHRLVKSGAITRTQAGALHRDDRAIRHEERGMARLDGGHITRADHRALNQQENSVGRQIGR